ncbi:MAG: hypothetical protein HS101_03375 [Planctomycetia bacterium]|nr:hypothetical protein [Planctomycetia bacterium]
MNRTFGKTMARRVAYLSMFCFFFLPISTGCGGSVESNSGISKDDRRSRDTPVLYFVHYPSRGKGLNDKEFNIAVWDDGHCLKWRYSSGRFDSLLAGICDKKAIDNLLRSFEQIGFFRYLADSYIVPDSHYITIFASFREQSASQSRALAPRNIRDNEIDSVQKLQFDDMWLSARQLVIEFTDTLNWQDVAFPIADQSIVRGLDLNRPSRTKWLLPCHEAPQNPPGVSALKPGH